MKIKIRNKILVAVVALVIVISPVLSVYAEIPMAPVSPIAPVSNLETPTAPTAPQAPLSPAEEKIVESVPISAPVVTAPSSVVTVPTAEIQEGNSEPQIQNPVSQTNLEVNNENQSEIVDSSKPKSESQTDITNKNEAEVDNLVKLEASTGENNSDYNTGNGSVSSGDSNVILSILNLINTVFVAPRNGNIGLIFGNIFGNLIGDYLVGPEGENYSLTGSRLDVENTNTGAGSSNSALVNMGVDTKINNVNNGNLANDIIVDANTGGNTSNYNTGNGEIRTGNANASLNLLNFMNSAFYARDYGLFGILNIFGDFVGNLVVPKSLASNSGSQPISVEVKNENTGANSDNDANVSLKNSLDVNNDNNADLANDIALLGNTGGNSSDYNTGSGNVKAGAVNADLNVANTANQNIVGDGIFYAIINVLGEWSGINKLTSLFKTYVLPNPTGDGQTIVVTNKNTGADSTNEADVNLSQQTEINNTNNAVINNKIKIAADTGGNSASYNTGNGNVETGDVSILANILNLSNLSVVANKFAFFVINIFGNWDGDISDEGSEQEEEDIPTVIVTPPSVVNTTSSSNTNISAFATGGPVYVASTSVAAVDDVEEVLSSNTVTLSGPDNSVGDETSPFMEFLNKNIWSILILLGIALITLSSYLYEKQHILDMASQ